MGPTVFYTHVTNQEDPLDTTLKSGIKNSYRKTIWLKQYAKLSSTFMQKNQEDP